MRVGKLFLKKGNVRIDAEKLTSLAFFHPDILNQTDSDVDKTNCSSASKKNSLFVREKKVKIETKLEPRQKGTLKPTEGKIEIQSQATVKKFRKVPLTRSHERDEDGYLISNDLTDYMLVKCRIC